MPPSSPTTPSSVRRRSALASLTPVDAPTLQESIYQRLRDALIKGQFSSGDTITIRKLARVFGTSPMPVREALHRLISEHALEPVGRRSIRVPVATLDHLRDLYATRRLIEGHAAELAARRMSKRELQELAHLNAAMEIAIAAHDTTAVIKCNQDFHFALYRASRAPTLLRAIEPLWLQSGPYVPIAYEAYESSGRLPASMTSHHRSLLVALQRRDARAARIAIQQDMQSSEDVLARRLTTTVAAPRPERAEPAGPPDRRRASG